MTLASSAFRTEFAVDMTCQNCVNAVEKALGSVPGIDRYDIELENKRVTITGKTPPSQLLSALKSTDRQVLVRGASSADASVPSEAAISILESPIALPSADSSKSLPGLAEDEFSQQVYGISRFVQIAPKSILMDLTVRFPPSASQSAFTVYVSKTGNLVDPPKSTGGEFLNLGKVRPDEKGYGDLFKEVEGQLWEWVGRACVVQKEGSEGESKAGSVFAGVVARSSGVWGNDKTVCACSGRTMWEEGREMEQKGV